MSDRLTSICFKKFRKDAKKPAYQTEGSAGMDVCALDDFTIWTDDFTIVATGIGVELPCGYEIQVRSRSGLAAMHGVSVLNSPGTVDADYRGEIKVILYNHGPHTYQGRAGDRIAQLVVAKVEQPAMVEVEELTETGRGDGGFGSTGR